MNTSVQNVTGCDCKWWANGGRKVGVALFSKCCAVVHYARFSIRARRRLAHLHTRKPFCATLSPRPKHQQGGCIMRSKASRSVDASAGIRNRDAKHWRHGREVGRREATRVLTAIQAALPALIDRKGLDGALHYIQAGSAEEQQ